MDPTRRAVLALGLAALVPRGAHAALRVPYGGVLRLPLPAPRRVLDPAGATDAADAWPLALVHEGLATVPAEGPTGYPLLAAPPVVNRADPRTVTLSLRPGVTFSSGALLDAAAVVNAWQAAGRSPLGRLALALCATQAPFQARGPLELVLRLAAPGLLDEVLGAWPLAVTGPRGAGLGPFVPRGQDPAVLLRNARCPLGAPFLERLELAAPRSRNDEVRAFVTSTIDASWRAAGLYEVSRAAQVVRGTPAAVVGLAPTLRGSLDRVDHARALERLLAPLAAGHDPLLGPLGFAPEGPAPDPAGLAQRVPALRIAREPADAFLGIVAERIVALLDAARIRVALVAPGEPADATLRAVAPAGSDPALALASFVAVAGDEASASAVARAPRPARAGAAAGAWSRGTAAVLGRAVPVLYLRAGVGGVRFDGAGRLLLGDAWVARGGRA